MPRRHARRKPGDGGHGSLSRRLQPQRSISSRVSLEALPMQADNEEDIS
jgi:hypothetical protein